MGAAALLAGLSPDAMADSQAAPAAAAAAGTTEPSLGSSPPPPGHEACLRRDMSSEDPWSACHPAVTTLLRAFSDSGYTDLRPFRTARTLTRRFIGAQDPGQGPTCGGTPPTWAKAACDLLKHVFTLDQPALGENQAPVWWQEMRRGEQLFQANRLDEAALQLRDAYDLCDRQQRQNPALCLPLLREMLDLRRVAAGERSERAHQDREDSLAFLERAFKATGRTCKTDPHTVFEELCEHRRALYLLRGEAHLDAQLYREAADDFELAYRTCTELGRQTLGCWASFGRASWRARQHELLAIHTAETTQLNRARDLLEHFVRDDMHRTCDDAGLPDAVRTACQDLKILAVAAPSQPGQPSRPPGTEPNGQPIFIAAQVVPGPLSETFARCMQRTLSPEACWPEVRARALDLSQATRTASPERSAEQLRRLRRDLGAYVRAAGIRCEQPEAPAEACTQVQQIDERLATVTVVPSPVHTSLPAPTAQTAKHDDRSNQRLRTAGAVTVALGGASLVLTGIGMYWGSQATQSGEEGRAGDPTRGAASVRQGSVFVSGENANKLVVGSAIVGGTALAAGIVLLVVDAVRRQRAPNRLSLRPGGVALSF